MRQEQIQQLFKKGYEQTKWKQFLAETFPSIRLFSNPEILTGIDSNVANQAYTLGYIHLNENGIDRQIAVYEVALSEGIILERNRVGLRNLLRKYWKDIDGAFIVYYNPASIIQKWRFTYVSELTGYNSEGEFVKITTEPKRYTYVLGEGESVRTATERFLKLADKGSSITLDDIKEAFSVEKLSKSFFDEYKNHYQIFNDYLINLSQARIFFSDYTDDKEKDIRDFTKKLLGRIVFLYFIQKKGWMGVSVNGKWGEGDPNFLTNLYLKHGNPNSFYNEKLVKLFFETLNTQRENDEIELIKGEKCRIPYLNGGLFEPEDTKKNNIIFDGKLFENLFDFFNQYNFTIYEDDPNDHTVAVDPEMLGHIFENLLEDNKDKGAFYTPKEIVHYMCQESLIEYLATHLSNEYTIYREIGNAQIELFGNELKTGQLKIIEQLGEKALNHDDVSYIVKNKDINNLTRKQLKKINYLLDNVKICDPAIGSGAFPMGLLQEIHSIKEVIAYETKQEWNPAEVKLNIIQNSIYGIDIEKGAVDIARLRFWLSLVVDDEEPKPLPNLDYKIVVGDSLVSKFDGEIIEIKWDKKLSVGKAEAYLNNIQDLLVKLTKKQKLFFNPNIKNKSELQAKIRNLKINLLINQVSFNKEHYINNTGQKGGFMPTTAEIKYNNERKFKIINFEILINKLKKLLDNSKIFFNHFDWKLDFPEILNPYLTDGKSGFDIIIANPPYIKEYTNKSAFDGFRNSPYYQGKMDIWYGFACKMLDYLKPKGIECFIAQNNWITSTGASKFRNKVLNDSEIILFTDFGNYKVFETAGIQTMIYIIQKSTPKNKYDVKYSVLKKDQINKSELIEFLNFSIKNKFSEKYYFNLIPSKLKDKPFRFNHSVTINILDKIKKKKNFYLTENEVANGIHSHYDFISKKIAEEFNGKYEKGEGIFVLSNNEKRSLGLSKDELKLVKPYFSTEQLHRYYADPKNKLWIIYTDSKFKNPLSMKPYPNLKRHLDKYKDIITSDNKPYGLHRAKKETFFKDESIIALRKCPIRPSFTYTDFDCYVSATFYLIKTDRLSIKYLTCILNSKLIEYWLRHKGKMQGNNYQIDKEPLLALPLFKTTSNLTVKIIEDLLDEILILKKEKITTKELEQKIDNIVYKLYELTYEEVKVIDPEFALSEEEYNVIEIE